MSRELPRNKDILDQHLVNILDLLIDGVYISDSKGNTLWVNTPYEKLTGISASVVVGRNVFDLVKQGVFSKVVNSDVVSTRKTITSVQEVNGRRVVLHGRPVLNQQGDVELVVTFVRDITVMSRLKSEIAAQNTLVGYYQRQVSTLDPEDVFVDDGVVAVDKASLKLLSLVENISPTDVTVLILGETGVGKDVLAKRIHKKSHRASERYLKVDCSAIPESLVESELFGYVSGAFSGAHAKGKEGYFERADKGTLFLDEVGELSLPMQTKLLRAINDQEIIRVGSTSVTKVNVRIIAATNKNLEQAVAKGNFRSDLFYRLKVAVVNVLPLRERRDDILPLLRVFLQRFNKKYKKNILLGTKAQNALLRYDWPGNVRELENSVHSLVVHSAKDRITCNDLPSDLAPKPNCSEFSPSLDSYGLGDKPFKEIIADIERDMINEAVRTYGSVAKAAEVLQLDRSTIFRKTKARNFTKA
jgi:PAS domain S-box-containing protein